MKIYYFLLLQANLQIYSLLYISKRLCYLLFTVTSRQLSSRQVSCRSDNFSTKVKVKRRLNCRLIYLHGVFPRHNNIYDLHMQTIEVPIRSKTNKYRSNDFMKRPIRKTEIRVRFHFDNLNSCMFWYEKQLGDGVW